MNQTHRLDLTSLTKATASLAEALAEYQRQPANKLIRDATIQRFEYTYELSHKMLKRYLEMTESSETVVDEMSFSHLIRVGSERGLLRNGWDVWSTYRYARNLTSHVYDEAKAEEVSLIIPGFLADAQHLLNKLCDAVEQL